MRGVIVSVIVFMAGCATEEDPQLGWDVPAEELGWTAAPPEDVGQVPSPLVGARATVVGSLVAGGQGRVGVTGAPAGATLTLLASLVGPGAGPCHPQAPAVCADILNPVVVATAVASAGGGAVFDEHIPARLGGSVWLQVGVAGGAVAGTTAVVADVITSMGADWVADDLLELSVSDGESGYDVGMAETGAGPNGWYAEDCWLGQYGLLYCHSVVGAGVRSLRSVHPNVGGPGVNFVRDDLSTLFYGGVGGIGGLGGGPDGDHPSLTYYFGGHDSGDCWTFGHDTTYYETALGCTPLY